MQIATRRIGDTVVVNVEASELDFTVAEAFTERIGKAGGAPEVARMVLNMECVTFIDSMAIGALVGLRKRFAAAGRRLELCGLHPYVRKVLGAVTVNAIFQVHENLDTALAGQRS